ncbi:enoyl-CoA hydratase [Mesorhizobium sp. Root554]|uniref:enoyl-CoA hydratase n=1 Tax=unclassified Mesorhizobium TaxID=325217 RepID=UPI0006F50FD2|nr:MULTISPECIES: enoyl-CoA hydratase [unclassified Mesorhizobium]KQZ13072.1 enoyl-CoA hydratase [Mesorhizobium sp. Root1471]KQZ35589.1 enoyl-CoA hydratase [Mesorhizobium sp. Root554]
MGEILAIKTIAPQSPLKVEMEGGILRLTLSNPPANALSLSVMAALQAQLDGILHDPSVRVIVLAAAPGKVFCAGHDLKEMTARRTDADGGKAFFEETFGACSRLMQSIVRHPKPVIAEIDGIATAAGCQVVASCDLAIASDQSTFGVNGIDVGLFCSTPGVALARGLKPKHAMEMLLTGEMIDASSAREFGLINRVVPREYLNQIVTKYAQVIAAKSPSAVRLGKKTFYEQAGMNLAEAYDHASKIMVENMLNADAQEGVTAFFGKRKPEWKGE